MGISEVLGNGRHIAANRGEVIGSGWVVDVVAKSIRWTRLQGLSVIILETFIVLEWCCELKSANIK